MENNEKIAVMIIETNYDKLANSSLVSICDTEEEAIVIVKKLVENFKKDMIENYFESKKEFDECVIRDNDLIFQFCHNSDEYHIVTKRPVGGF